MAEFTSDMTLDVATSVECIRCVHVYRMCTYVSVSQSVYDMCHTWYTDGFTRDIYICVTWRVQGGEDSNDALSRRWFFRERATNYRAFLREMTCKDKASYDSTLPCSVCTTQLCHVYGNPTTYCNTLQHICNTLQHTATHCNTLRHAATHCNTLADYKVIVGNLGMSHVTYGWVTSHTNESHHTWTTHERVTSYMNESRHTWTSHVT